MPYLISQKAPRQGGAGTALLSQGDLGGLSPHPCTAAGRAGIVSIAEFYRQGKPVVDACLQRQQACCIGIADIDRFERLSRTHGHRCAGAVLDQFADELVTLVSAQGMMLGYLGGNRFAILLAGKQGAEAHQIFDGLRRDLASRPRFWQAEKLMITVSMGVADIHGLETFDNYLNAAEQFLFMAKTYGRNRLVSDHSFAAALH